MGAVVTSLDYQKPIDTRAGAALREADESPRADRTAERTYVLDTSVLLSDPTALFRFAEHAVVLPVIVIAELEAKRHDPEIGYFARKALRTLDDLRIEHERLDFPIPVGDGGSLRVELNHSNMAVLPNGLQLKDNDSRILAVALNLANEGLDVTVVSKDLPLRVKAASIGLAAEEYRAELAPESGWTGMTDLTLGFARDRRSLRAGAPRDAHDRRPARQHGARHPLRSRQRTRASDSARGDEAGSR